ncbi:MAG TPA: hypothetical protein VHV51_05395 [Polyangiaceae bacterium]|nr:hypothetical protein [Polyangiaceae bacterium]
MSELSAVDSGTRVGSAPSPLRALRDRASTVLPGLYAWVTTIALPTVQHSAKASAKISAFCALVALILAPLFAREQPRLGRALGVYVFIGFALLTWVLLGAPLLQHAGDPWLAALGGVAFMLYALGWGSLRRRDQIPEDDPNIIPGTPLMPRSRPPALVPAVFAVIVASALVPTFLAFRVVDAERALFAHAVALLSAILTITAGSRVALGLGQRRALPPTLDRLNAAAVPLALLALAFGLGFLWLVVR